MNMVVHKTCFMILFAFLLATSVTALMAQEVYKVVDKDGNVTFTDQPPVDGSKPIKLAPISVIEAPTYEKAPEPADEADGEKEPSLSDMRKIYRDFAIISPEQEESVWKPDGPTPVAWSARTALLPGMVVTLFLDGKRHSTTVQQMIPLSGLDRGEHTVKAELRDSKNRIVATAGAITFFVRQPNLYNRARR
jgi:hypothetical protein